MSGFAVSQGVVHAAAIDNQSDHTPTQCTHRRQSQDILTLTSVGALRRSMVTLVVYCCGMNDTLRYCKARHLAPRMVWREWGGETDSCTGGLGFPRRWKDDVGASSFARCPAYRRTGGGGLERIWRPGY